jgi:hypothetical protein
LKRNVGPMKENYTSRSSPILPPRTRLITDKPPMRTMKVRYP